MPGAVACSATCMGTAAAGAPAAAPRAWPRAPVYPRATASRPPREGHAVFRIGVIGRLLDVVVDPREFVRIGLPPDEQIDAPRFVMPRAHLRDAHDRAARQVAKMPGERGVPLGWEFGGEGIGDGIMVLLAKGRPPQSRYRRNSPAHAPSRPSFARLTVVSWPTTAWYTTHARTAVQPHPGLPPPSVVDRLGTAC